MALSRKYYSGLRKSQCHEKQTRERTLEIKVIKKTKPKKKKKRKIKKQMYSANLNWIQYVKHLNILKEY